MKRLRLFSKKLNKKMFVFPLARVRTVGESVIQII
jgi:hypothetical protein